ncbi:MAG: fatty acid desaturase [Fimbriimonadaceae bacterium]|nr:fatty acid desaturase [Fimbriimonadaceae bacterium]
MSSQARPTRTRPAWVEAVAPYQHADTPTALLQILNSFLPFIVCWVGAYQSVKVHPLLGVAWSLLAALFLVRIFIIQHDCGHGSFFDNMRWNDWVGRAGSLITLTAYHAWRHDHAVHHATSGNLDRRGIGDIKTLTVAEYLALSPAKRLHYRLYRHPVLLFLVGPWLHFALFQRFTYPNAGWPEKRSVWSTNLALLLVYGGLGAWLGWGRVLLVQVPITMIASTLGVWLFYVQHQFEDAYWARKKEWDYSQVALKGSSYYRLPAVLQWFTGNIGLHHVHHLSPKIPNYRLQQCHDENPLFHEAKTLTIAESLSTIKLTLWDEERGRLVSFRELPAELPRAA